MRFAMKKNVYRNRISKLQIALKLPYEQSPRGEQEKRKDFAVFIPEAVALVAEIREAEAKGYRLGSDEGMLLEHLLGALRRAQTETTV